MACDLATSPGFSFHWRWRILSYVYEEDFIITELITFIGMMMMMTRKMTKVTMTTMMLTMAIRNWVKSILFLCDFWLLVFFYSFQQESVAEMSLSCVQVCVCVFVSIPKWVERKEPVLSLEMEKVVILVMNLGNGWSLQHVIEVVPLNEVLNWCKAIYSKMTKEWF